MTRYCEWIQSRIEYEHNVQSMKLVHSYRLRSTSERSVSDVQRYSKNSGYWACATSDYGVGLVDLHILNMCLVYCIGNRVLFLLKKKNCDEFPTLQLVGVCGRQRSRVDLCALHEQQFRIADLGGRRRSGLVSQSLRHGRQIYVILIVRPSSWKYNILRLKSWSYTVDWLQAIACPQDLPCRYRLSSWVLVVTLRTLTYCDASNACSIWISTNVSCFRIHMVC